MDSKVTKAFRHCERIARTHYENFPIGWFLPSRARRYVYAIYAFARAADDFSDEERYEGERLGRLDAFEKKLDRCLRGEVEEEVEGEVKDPIFIALSETVAQTGLPPSLLKDLLKAFRMDVTKKRYRDYRELEGYCLFSANPIGRIVLHLFGYTDPRLFELSDRICTGIQLVNHWQDIAIDLSRDRVYLPQEDLRRFGYSYEDLKKRRLNDPFRSLLRFEISRTRSLFYEGKPLLDHLHRKLRWQVSLMWLGPMRILDRIEKNNYDVFHSRPTLSKRDKARLLLSLPGRLS